MKVFNLDERGSRIVVITMATAAFASLVALGAGGVAVYALSEKQTAAPAPAVLPQTPSTTNTVDEEPLASEVQNVTPSESPSEVDPTPDYTLAYEKVALKIPLPKWCSGSVSVDVDGPGVNSGSAEFTRTRCASPDSLEFTNVSGSADATESTTPSECLDKINVAPMGDGAKRLVSSLHSGDVFCLMTQKENATILGIHQRVALFQFKGVDEDGGMVAQMTAWDVPD